MHCALSVHSSVQICLLRHHKTRRLQNQLSFISEGIKAVVYSGYKILYNLHSERQLLLQPACFASIYINKMK